jgi:hypothetical protein
MARNCQTIADRKKLSRIEPGHYIPQDLPRAKSKRKPKAKSGRPENKAGHNSNHLCVNFQLTYRHHSDEENDKG